MQNGCPRTEMSRTVTGDERRSTWHNRRQVLSASLLQGAGERVAHRSFARRVAVVLPDGARAPHGNPTADRPRLPARASRGHDCRYQSHPSRKTAGETAVVAQATRTDGIAR